MRQIINMCDDVLEVRENGHCFDLAKPLPAAQDPVILATSMKIYDISQCV